MRRSCDVLGRLDETWAWWIVEIQDVREASGARAVTLLLSRRRSKLGDVPLRR
jgi:hypothetical protein